VTYDTRQDYMSDAEYSRLIKAEKKMVKKKRTPAQIRATKKLVALNKKKRAKKKVGRVSQITKRKPTARLKARRAKPKKKGYFANPIGQLLAIWLETKSDSSGNPRRLFIIVNMAGKVEAVIDEGYRGESAIKDAGFRNVSIIGRFTIPTKDYRDLLKSYPNTKK